jgi:hypothetical protein
LKIFYASERSFKFYTFLRINLIPTEQAQTSDTTLLTPVPENVLRHLVILHRVWTSTNQQTNQPTNQPTNKPTNQQPN